ncbi:MAG: VOC family protein [Planctomycetota bacterium]|nr:MAG: VOC family protein [Planctomycetota bacterium]
MAVHSLEESVKFYCKLFDFEVKKNQRPKHNSMIVGNEHIKLCLYETEGAGDRRGIDHFGIHVKNFDQVVEICEKMGVPMPYGVVKWEKSRSVYIVDPNGYEIELTEFVGGRL